MSFFAGHVVDLLRLAEDEARMLGRAVVEPEHMLLAFCRHGHGRDLLAQQSLQSRDLHAAVVRIHREGTICCSAGCLGLDAARRCLSVS